MIASFTHDFIFLKTRKVGGTSLEIVLSSWCRSDDICSPVTKEDEELRASYGSSARNYRAADGSVRFYNHMPGTEVRRELPELWPSAFKFTVERHPYEKVISRAWWNIGRRGGSPELELDAEIDKAIDTRSYLNFPIYCDGDAVLVDEIWRYEEMWDRLRMLADRLGLPEPTELPRAKGEHRKDRTAARDILSRAQRDRIRDDARVEFELLGFEP